MAELFDKNADTIGLHIRNIYKENELSHLAWVYELAMFSEKNT